MCSMEACISSIVLSYPLDRIYYNEVTLNAFASTLVLVESAEELLIIKVATLLRDVYMSIKWDPRSRSAKH